MLNLEGMFVVEEDFCGTYWFPGGTIISYGDLGAYADVDVGAGAGATEAAVAAAFTAQRESIVRWALDMTCCLKVNISLSNA